MSRKVMATLLAMILSVLGAGCSQSSDESGASPQSQQPEGEPQQGGTITIGARAEPDSLNPYTAASGDAQNIIILLYDTLVQIDPAQDYELVPGLAESWKVSKDGLTWTFDLRDGVTFSDGSPFTAADVKWSLEQASSPEAANTNAQLADIQKVSTPDDTTLVIELGQPDRQLLTTLTYVYVTKEGAEDYNNAPVGTGPFQLETWDRNRQILLNANDDYWMEDKPYLDKVVVKTIPDASVRTQQLLSKELDMVTIVPYNQIEQVKGAGMNLPTLPESDPVRQGQYDLRINTRTGPLADKKVRQAMSYAIDRSAISDAMFGLMPVFANPVPDNNEYFSPEAATYEHDVDKAKELLAEAGYSDGVDIGTVQVHAESGPEYEVIAQLVQSQLAEAGITMSINTTTVANWIQQVLVKNDFDIGLSRSIPLPSAYELIAHEYAASNKAAFGWDNQDFYDLLADARTMTDDDEYADALKQLQVWAMDGMPAVVLGGAVNPPGLQPYVKGFQPNAELTIDLTGVWLAE